MGARDDLAAALYDVIGGPWMSGAPEWSEFADRLIRAGWHKVDVTTIKAAAWNECAGAMRITSEADAVWLKSVNPYVPSP